MKKCAMKLCVMKRWLGIILAVIMIFTGSACDFPGVINVSAAGNLFMGDETTAEANVKKDGQTTYYDTIESAWAAAKGGGTATVTLLRDSDITDALTIGEGDDITFDGGSYRLLSVVSAFLVNGGRLNIIGGTINISGRGNYGVQCDDGRVEIQNGTINATNYGEGLWCKGGTIEISGGNISAYNTGVGVRIDGGKAIISGGTISTTEAYALEIGENGLAELSGGRFQATSSGAINVGSADGTVGGLLSEGFQYIKNNDTVVTDTDVNRLFGDISVEKICQHSLGEDGRCNECQGQITARLTVGSDVRYYLRVGDAWEAAKAAGEHAFIELLADVSRSSRLEVGEGNDITFDGGEYTLTVENDTEVFYSGGGSLTITGGRFDGRMRSSLSVEGGTVTLTGGTFTAADTTIISNTTVRHLLGSGYLYYDADGVAIENMGVKELSGTVTVREGNLCAHEWADGICSKCHREAEASVTVDGETEYYLFFNEACAEAGAATKTAVLTVLKDVSYDTTEPLVLQASECVVLKGEGHTVSGRSLAVMGGIWEIHDIHLPNTLYIMGNRSVVLNGCVVDVLDSYDETQMGTERGTALYISSGRNANINNCTLRGVFYGIFVERSINVVIGGGTTAAATLEGRSGNDDPDTPCAGLYMPGNDRSSVTLNGGTFSGDKAAILIDSGSGSGSKTVGDLLGYKCAYFDGDGALITGKRGEYMLERAVTVKDCTHEEVSDNGDGTHNINCDGCGIHQSDMPHAARNVYVVSEGNKSAEYTSSCQDCGAQTDSPWTAEITEDFTVPYGQTSDKELKVTVAPGGEALEGYWCKDGVELGDGDVYALPGDLEIGEYEYVFHAKVTWSVELHVTVTVEPKTVIPVITGSAAKVYDGTAAYDGAGLSLSLDGVLEADRSGVTASASYAFDSADAGENKTITATITELSGDKAERYVLASNTAAIKGKIEKAGQAAPGAPTALDTNIRDTSITLTAAGDNFQYSRDGEHWQDSPEFTGLSPDTAYTFYARVKEDANHNASPASGAASFTTKKSAPGGTGNSGTGGAGNVSVPKEEQEKNAAALTGKLKISQSGKKISVSWGKVAGADGYDIYVQYSDRKFTEKSITSIKNGKAGKATVQKVNGKALDLKKSYKAYVLAYRMADGRKVTLGESMTVYAAGKNNKKYTNAKAVKVKKSSYRLKKGKTAKIKASVILADKKKKQLSNVGARPFRYISTNKKVATVSASGKIKAAGKGKCLIYVCARNGYAKKIRVTVK